MKRQIRNKSFDPLEELASHSIQSVDCESPQSDSQQNPAVIFSQEQHAIVIQRGKEVEGDCHCDVEAQKNGQRNVVEQWLFQRIPYVGPEDAAHEQQLDTDEYDCIRV